MSSLFGGGAQQSSGGGGGGGLFGNSQTPASQAAKPSLFGQTAQPASSNLFGGSLGASTAASQPQSTGLFGPKPTTGGGMFGMGTSASQPAQQSTSAMFPTLGQSISQPGQQQQQGQTQPEGSQFGQSKGPGSLQAAYFDQILERGKKRNSQDNGGGLGDLPSLQLGLGDIARKVRNLGNGGPSAEHAKAGDSRA